MRPATAVRAALAVLVIAGAARLLVEVTRGAGRRPTEAANARAAISGHDAEAPAAGVMAGASGAAARGEAGRAPAAGDEADRTRSTARSLAGTDVDGAWPRDDAGRFVLGSALRRRFDYFLSAQGEEDEAAIRAHVVASARAELATDDAARAVAVYDRYVGYRAALAGIAPPASAADGRARLGLVVRTQEEWFGPADAALLFGEDDALAELLVTRRDLARADLDAESRAAALAAAEAALPPALRAARAERAALAAAVAATVGAR